MRVIEQAAKAAHKAMRLEEHPRICPEYNLDPDGVDSWENQPPQYRGNLIAGVEAALKVYNVNPELVQQCRDKLVNVMAHVASDSPPPLPDDLWNRKIMQTASENRKITVELLPSGDLNVYGAEDARVVQWCKLHSKQLVVGLRTDDIQPDAIVSSPPAE